MKSINTYYVDQAQLKLFIHDNNISNSSSLLIQVFSAVNDKVFISTLLSELTDILPDAVIIGSTTDGEIMDGKVSSGKVVLNFTQFEHTTLKVASIEHKVNGYFGGKYLAEKLIDEDTQLFITFVDGLHTNGEEFLNGINSVSEEVIVVGGHAGDNSQFIETMVFTKDSILNHGSVAVTLNSTQLQVHTDYSFNWHPIGNELTITKAIGNRIYTIDDRTAVDTYAHYLGEQLAMGLPAIGIEFPLMINRNGLDISRAAIAKNDDGSLIVAGNLYTGEKVRIGYGDSKEILQNTHHVIENMSKKPSECIFIYSCSTRKYFMAEGVESESLPLQQLAPVSGFFTYGEFFTSTKKELFNQTMTLVSLSESDKVGKKVQSHQEKKIDINSTSINALTHLIKVSIEEIEKTHQLNQELQERMELALLGSNDGVWDWNIIDDSVYFSPRWKEMLGYSDEELSNDISNWTNRLHPEDADKVWEDVNKNINKETEYYESIHRLKHKDGHWVWILDRGKVLFDENGKAIRMIGTHADISEEKELQLKYLYQAQIIEQIHNGVITTDLEGIVLSWNLGAKKLYGYSENEMIGKHISIIYRKGERDRLKKEIRSRLLDTGIYNEDLIFITKSNDTIDIALSITLLKDEYGNTIGRIGINQDITERKKAEDTFNEQKNILHYQALHDVLTGLPNRLLFQDRLKHGIKSAERHTSGLAIFFIDLDKFKQINDSLGHDVGDSVLKAVAKRLKRVIREEDTLARLGGDEFTVIMNNLKYPENAEILAKKILKVLAEPLYIDGHILYITGSIGISLYPQDANEAKALLKYADTAMYKAKEEGHNNFKFYSLIMTKFALEKMHMKTALQQAIENQEFIIHYQPQINTRTNKLIGIEALVRWKHPTMGLLYPDKFIALAEETGLIIEIDKWMMKTAMKQVSNWYKSGLNPGVLALNLSVKQLEYGGFSKKVANRLKQYDFDPKWLELEITEGQMMRKTEEVIKVLNQINDLGIRISIDDFGTGYSSLLLLKKLPIHRLKIDRSFVKDIPHDEEDVAIIEAIIALAISLNLDLIAEGVENKEQKDFLYSHKCINIQGNYYSRPISVQEMEKLLLKDTL